MKSALTLAILGASVSYTTACTTLIAGKAATTDGSVFCSHSNDGEGTTDPRLVHIPARDHAEKALRPVYFAPESYPRYVGGDRGAPAYYPATGQTPFVPIGYIPEVAHTYAYHESTYGSLNEHQLGIGESTCSGIFGAKAAGHGGKALLSVDTLSQLAMERSTTSRDAVKLMGSLAEQYGFYGAASGFEGSAESLMVTDPNEGWIFHILPDPTGESAIWAAVRVPDDHVGVVANAFMIRELNASSPDVLFSDSVHTVALSKGWWKASDGPLDFTKVYSDGEYAHKYYSGRRVWAAYHMLAPSLNFSPEYDEWRKSKPYPATAKPDAKVDVAKLASVMRSYYQGTQFDQTVGLAGGPFGTPDHVVGVSATGKVKGNWERTIGLFRTSDSHIVQSRGYLPNQTGGVLWWGAHAAPYTIYLPFVAGMTALPDVTLGQPSKLDKETLFWRVRTVANLAQLKWSYAYKEVQAMQAKIEGEAEALVGKMDALAQAGAVPDEKLNGAYGTFAEAVAEWLGEFADMLLFKYADGFVSEWKEGTFDSVAVPYPDWWLKAVNFTGGPPPVPSA